MSTVQHYVPTDIDISIASLFDYKGQHSVNIKTMIAEFNVYEDLYSSTMKADITIVDALGLIERLPIIGEEFLILSFRTPVGPKGAGYGIDDDPESIDDTYNTYLFFVYKIEKAMANTRTHGYTLHCVSNEFILSMQQSLDTSYINQPISDIIQQVRDSFLTPSQSQFNLINGPKRNKVAVEQTQGIHTCTTSSKSPLQFINYLAQQAQSEKYPGSNYRFWEDVDGFHFKSLQSLFDETNNPIVESYYFIEFHLSENNTSGPQNQRVFEYQKIISLEFDKSVDVISNYYNGLYNVEVLSLDLLRKNSVRTMFDYHKDFDQLQHAGSNQVISSESIHKSGSQSCYKMFSSKNALSGQYDQLPYIVDKHADNDPYLTGFDRRQIFTHLETPANQQNNQIVLNIAIPGDTARKVGDAINVFIPQNSSDEDFVSKWNILYGKSNQSAKFIITAVNHFFNAGQIVFLTNIQCIKDSYDGNLQTESDRLTETIPDVGKSGPLPELTNPHFQKVLAERREVSDVEKSGPLPQLTNPHFEKVLAERREVSDVEKSGPLPELSNPHFEKVLAERREVSDVGTTGPLPELQNRYFQNILANRRGG